jgi:deoxyribodipyrimidine photo-lyase
MDIDTQISIFWFRRDLRLKDNHGLFKALSSGQKVLPIFIFDTNILDDLNDRADPRVTFIYDKIRSINDKLVEFGSGITIHIGQPIDIFKRLTEQYYIFKVFANRDYEPYGGIRDREIGYLLKERGIQFELVKDHVIFEENEILKDDGTPYKVFTAYKKRWLEKFNQETVNPFPSEDHTLNFLRSPNLNFPSLADVGFLRKNIKFPPESIPINIIQSYDKTRDFPGMQGTSRLGIHLRFGTLSIRKAVMVAWENNEVWLNELIWREFYTMILFQFPNVVKDSFKKEYDRIQWVNDAESFEQWKAGQTGFPLVDAGMRELNETGYMHNRVRMITASFLTKHLLIDWRMGEAYFAEKLLDYELASNNGGWQWAAGTGTDAQPYFRVFNPISQAEKFDPAFSYIRRWVPEYLSDRYIKPIIDHKFARERAISIYKQALK